MGLVVALVVCLVAASSLLSSRCVERVERPRGDATAYAEWAVAAACMTAAVPVVVALSLVPVVGSWWVAVPGVVIGGCAGVVHGRVLARTAEALGAPAY